MSVSDTDFTATSALAPLGLPAARPLRAAQPMRCLIDMLRLLPEMLGPAAMGALVGALLVIAVEAIRWLSEAG